MDYDRIKKHDGYVHYWQLHDWLKPDKAGNLSYMFYVQVDCERFPLRYRTLTWETYNRPMGGGNLTSRKTFENHAWLVSEPGALDDNIRRYVCDHK